MILKSVWLKRNNASFYSLLISSTIILYVTNSADSSPEQSTTNNLALGLSSSSSNAILNERSRGGECPRNWIRYDRTKCCFFVIEQRLRWDEAERVCNKYGGHLASIVDEYENIFAFDVAKKANLSVPTLWLGRLVKLTKTGAYEWNDGSIGRHSDGFREPPSGTDLCLTMWLDFDRPDGSWNEWDCSYASGYSSLCKKSFKRVTPIPAQVLNPHVHHSRRCCVSALCSNRCTPSERCIPDDLDCWTKTCQNTGPGWCLPAP